MTYRSIGRFVTTLLTISLIATIALAQSVGGSLTFADDEEPDTLDPQKTSTANAGRILQYAGDTLLRKNLQGEYIPGLAESWEASDDGLTWTFTLREGVTFHNGEPLTADDVRASIERALAPETQSPIAASLFEAVTEIDVTGEYTLSLTLDEPFAPFLSNLTDSRGSIVDVDAAEEMGDEFGRAPVLTGPWKVADWESGNRIVLERNPDYTWGPAYTRGEAPYIEELVFRTIPESATQVAAFEAGEVDILPTVPPTDVERLMQDDRFVMESFLRNGVGLFMEFNTQAEPFTDPTVRTAMNHAIDKQVIVQIALRDLGEAAYGVLPPSIWGYWEGIEEYAPQYNSELALETFAQAGWDRDGDGPLMKDGEPFTFTLFTAPIDTWTRSAQIVQGQLAELGIEMEIQTYEFGTLLERYMAGEQQAGFMGYTYTNPDIVHLWFHSSNIGTGLAHSHFPSEELDGLIERSRTETDLDAREEIYAEIQRFISDEALWVPLWTNENFIGIGADVQGVEVHPDGYAVLNDAHLE